MELIHAGGRRVACLLLLGACLVAGPARAAIPRTLADVRAAGSLACGVVVEQEDFTKNDSHGDLSGFSAAICRAVAAAVLGDAVPGDAVPGKAGRVQLQGFPDDAHGVAALRAGRIALLVGTTPETTRGMLSHLRFTPTLFADGQGFLMRRGLHPRALADLHDRLVCFLSEMPADAGLVEWTARTGVRVRPHPFEEGGEMEAALKTGHCDAITADVSALAGMRHNLRGHDADFDILPDTISFDPFAAATRDDDPVWTTIVSDVVTALIEAEQDGITGSGVDAKRNSSDPAARRLLGPTPGLVGLLGLTDGWAARAIAVSGNYGEILGATTGPATTLGLARGRNALWNQGGLIGAPAFP